MKLLLVALLGLASSAIAADAPTLKDDTQSFVGEKGRIWRSHVLDVEFADGSHAARALALEFVPAEKEGDRPIDASVKLSVVTPPEPPDFNTEGKFGDGSFRDVRLAEKDGSRSITITRSLKTIDRPTAKTELRLARTSLVLTYEFKDGELILQGFPKDKFTWGVTQFKLRDTELKFAPE